MILWIVAVFTQSPPFPPLLCGIPRVDVVVHNLDNIVCSNCNCATNFVIDNEMIPCVNVCEDNRIIGLEAELIGLRSSASGTSDSISPPSPTFEEGSPSLPLHHTKSSHNSIFKIVIAILCIVVISAVAFVFCGFSILGFLRQFGVHINVDVHD